MGLIVEHLENSWKQPEVGDNPDTQTETLLKPCFLHSLALSQHLFFFFFRYEMTPCLPSTSPWIPSISHSVDNLSLFNASLELQ